MTINDVHFNADATEIVEELQSQLHANNINLINTIKDTPDNVMIQCPYHNNGAERKPSAGIKKDDGTFHCFSCGEVHTLPEVISHCFGRSGDMVGAFGWNWLLKNFASVAIETRQDIQLDFGRGVVKHEDVCANYIQEEELDSYRYVHPYMYKRGLTDEIIELFDIGYDKNSDCITFPVRDIHGNTLFIARRSVKTKYFNYPQGVEKPLYGLYELSQYWKGEYNTDVLDEHGILHDIREYAKPYISEVIVCESMLDALKFWTVGKYAVALNGTGSELQIKQLNELPCREIILCTDMDEAGMNARYKLKKRIKGKILMQYMLPEGRKDANDCTPEELKNLIPKLLK